MEYYYKCVITPFHTIVGMQVKMYLDKDGTLLAIELLLTELIEKGYKKYSEYIKGPPLTPGPITYTMYPHKIPKITPNTPCSVKVLEISTG